MEVYLSLILLIRSWVVFAQVHNGVVDLPVPSGLTLQSDSSTQVLSLTWESDSSHFDIEIFHTELMNTVLNETVESKADPSTGQHVWSWRSELPLECTSHSAHIRARYQQTVSQWSSLQTIPGSDVPEQFRSQMYPQDKVVPVGSNITFCCIVGEKKNFDRIMYHGKEMNATRVSRRTYTITVVNQYLSGVTGTNVICYSEALMLTGAVVFVTYPPGDEHLVCETRDLTSAVCSWKEGRGTQLKKKSLRTKYTLNGRDCLEANEWKIFQCNWTSWEHNWTLVAQNPLGRVQLTDSALLADRVHLLAPLDVTAVDVKAWNATLKWRWSVAAYEKLDMICQLKLNSYELTITRNFSATGLSSVLLDGLWPDVGYSVSVRCGSLHNFWRWGDESVPYRIHTKIDRPDPLDVWMWKESEKTGWVLWKMLSVRESHGAIDGFQVSQRSADDDQWTTVSLSPNNLSYPITLSNSSDITVTVAARNPAGVSQSSAVTIPAYRADSQLKVSELTGSNGGFDLSWSSDVNVSDGFVVEWIPTGCSGLCSVNWLKVPESNTSIRLQSESLEPGVRYNVSVYVLSDGAPVLLKRWNGYTQELVPIESVGELSVVQISSDVLLSWNENIPMKQQRGFIRGYTVYRADAANMELLGNVSDPDVRSYRIKGLSLGSYKFVVKAYNSAGEDSGSTVAIKLAINVDLMVVGILVSLGSMFFCLTLISIFCYKKREWVKKAFYPEIPGPKVSGDWSSPQGPLDLKPAPHSLVHIMESQEWDLTKKTLVPVPEEEEGEESENENIDVDSDSDEPALLKYYNQVVGEGSRSTPLSDSSCSSTFSAGSGQTEITYTGIQSPSFSDGAYGGGGGYKPQMRPVTSSDESNVGFESDFQEANSSTGYKPQCSWQIDSPEAENFNGSLGSPTSVTSSQFLIPESSEEKTPAHTWFHSFLSRKS